MLIRPAKCSDVPRVIPMVKKIVAFHQTMDPAKYAARDDVGSMYQHWLSERAEDARAVFLVAEQDTGSEAGALTGFLIATIEKEIPIYLLREFGIVHDLWVEELYRHEGIGRQMTMLAIERFAELEVKQIRLYVASGNSPAKGLFERCGFRSSCEEMLIEVKRP